MSGLQVVHTGPLALLQDLGRPGYAAMGVGRAGAADRGAYLLGGRLLGHDFHVALHESIGAERLDTGPAALELLLGGFEAHVRGEVSVAITGAPAPTTVDGRRIDIDAPVRLHDGQTLRIGTPARGLRTYLSVRGGFDVEPVLGSRSRDTLAGLGPEVTDGMDLPVGGTRGEPLPNVDHVIVPPPPADEVELEVLPGPRQWLRERGRLATTSWEVSDRSDRVGVRLAGEPLERWPELVGVELPSEGVVRGSVQVPPNGQPVLFMSDHPVTGGYPCVGVLSFDSADRAAQLRPGQHVHLRLVDRPSHPGQ